MPRRPDAVLTFGRTVVEIWDRDCVRTTLPDGAEVVAAPEPTASYRAQAERLGYGTDSMRMCVDHEVLHSALAAWLGLSESPTLGRVARGQGDSDLTGMEEDAVLALQRFANAAGVDLLARLAR